MRSYLRTRCLVFAAFLLILTPGIALAGTYWVSPSGTAAWTVCRGFTDPGTYCSLDLANTNVVAGDTIYLKGGTYSTHIFPAKSGTETSRITYAAAAGETPVIINKTKRYYTYFNGILLTGRSYITVRGITVGPDSTKTMTRLLQITSGANYNEIDSCKIYGNFYGENVAIWKGSSAASDDLKCQYNWIHNSVIANTGRMFYNGSFVQTTMGLQIGIPGYDKVSGNNSITDNVFYCNGHHNIETFTKYNVIANNFIHDEGCMENSTGYGTNYSADSNGKWGHRNIQIYDGFGEEGKYNLIEGNRLGPSGAAPEDDGGDGFTLTAPKNIFRYNTIYSAQNNGLLLKTGSGSLADNNRIYNNTFFNSGRYRNHATMWQGCNIRWYGSYKRVGNVIKNNLLYKSGSGYDFCGGATTVNTDNTVTSNWLTSNGNPGFVNASTTVLDDENTPDLSLLSTSTAAKGGVHLTTAVGAGTKSTTLVVADALYFQDGTWGSPLAGYQADWIAIGGTANAVQISSINYATNTITLAAAKTWATGAKIWLYKRADGTRVLYGSYPGYGASPVMATSSSSGASGTSGTTK